MGPKPPFLREKGAPTKILIPNVPTEISFGIGMVNTRTIPTNTNQKYQIGKQL